MSGERFIAAYRQRFQILEPKRACTTGVEEPA